MRERPVPQEDQLRAGPPLEGLLAGLLQAGLGRLLGLGADGADPLLRRLLAEHGRRDHPRVAGRVPRPGLLDPEIRRGVRRRTGICHWSVCRPGRALHSRELRPAADHLARLLHLHGGPGWRHGTGVPAAGRAAGAQNRVFGSAAGGDVGYGARHAVPAARAAGLDHRRLPQGGRRAPGDRRGPRAAASVGHLRISRLCRRGGLERERLRPAHADGGASGRGLVFARHGGGGGPRPRPRAGG
mmetsp:Transcript_58579/g.164312  ORF Transcript_58579/g.164312 Transcript_58579/m.164312 type:complete len:242 (+) Transcript_58579:142-867(+)